jgi:hypothetical protein
MSTIYSSSYLKTLGQYQNLNESRIFSARNDMQTSFDIFLSHSYLDKEIVKGLYRELTIMGFKVYVDWIIDTELDRGNVTKETATKIRNRLNMSKTLLLAISENATVSKWMPWELGYGDGYTHKCAIIPVSESSYNYSTSWKGVEYLSLYPFIKKHNTSDGKEKLWVIENANKYVMFDSWLKYDMNPSYQNVNIY